MKRRHALGALGLPPLTAALGTTGLLGASSTPIAAAASDYRALVVVFLDGGNDGLNTLVPTDGAHLDYSRARPELALPKDGLVALGGVSAGHSFGLHPGLAPLASLYDRRRLAWIVNTGVLIEPATAEQVMNLSVRVPAFLGSHSDQRNMSQGWMGDTDASGWAGRAIERFPSSLRNEVQAATFDRHRALVLGQHSRVSFISPGGPRFWGDADLARPEGNWAQSLNRIAKWQFSNEYQAEFARTLGGSVIESTLLTQIYLKAQEPRVSFEGNNLASNLRSLASILPVFKAMGFKRQVFLITWGRFDTHVRQRGSDSATQDAQLATVGKALAAFDQANVDAGMNADVTTLVMTEFGRTLRAASGAGSDHAWGNHWCVMGGPVAGGQVLGQLPSLTLAGPDDYDPQGGGRFVPTTSADQVGSTLMQWMGLPVSAVNDVFPNLKNFAQKTLPFLNS